MIYLNNAKPSMKQFGEQWRRLARRDKLAQAQACESP
jgi:hypothetical protein